jgi:DNA polymerase (family 10)
VTKPTNESIADVLERIAELLEVQGANPHRVRAYRNGADSVRSASESLAGLVQAGDEAALQDLPGIGEGLARVITSYVKRGHSDLLDRLQGQVSPERLFAQVPGIGEELGRRIASQLDVHSLAELEQAAHDGRLEKLEGFGPKRIQAVQVSLAGMLSRAAQTRARRAASDEGEARGDREERPDVKILLEVDADYRRRAKAGELERIAPRRFNPEGKAWLPIMHTERDGWDMTVLYSNTARAHELGTTHDWVVIYYERRAYEGQATVVTARQGPLAGKRVVRGREAACRRYYGK